MWIKKVQQIKLKGFKTPSKSRLLNNELHCRSEKIPPGI